MPAVASAESSAGAEITKWNSNELCPSDNNRKRQSEPVRNSVDISCIGSCSCRLSNKRRRRQLTPKIREGKRKATSAQGFGCRGALSALLICASFWWPSTTSRDHVVAAKLTVSASRGSASRALDKGQQKGIKPGGGGGGGGSGGLGQTRPEVEVAVAPATEQTGQCELPADSPCDETVDVNNLAATTYHHYQDQQIGSADSSGSIVVGGGENSTPLVATEQHDVSTLLGQLVLLVTCLSILILLLNTIHRLMTNLLSKIFSGERRRSLAASRRPSAGASSASQQQLQATGRAAGGGGGGGGVAQSHSSSTLSLPRNSSPSLTTTTTTTSSSNSHQRRASRSSIHSVSAMLMSALTGGTAGGGQSSSGSGHPAANNDGRSIIAKNKEDTVIIASSSPTIIQKESTDSGTSTVVNSTGCSVQSPSVPLVGAGGAIGSHAATAASEADAELFNVDQTLYDSVRHPLALAAATAQSNLLALAAAAAAEPKQATASNQASGSQQQHQLPTVSTQLFGAGCGQTAGAPATTVPGATAAHAPLNATNTMKQAPQAQPAKKTPETAAAARRSEVIRATELLLNAINCGDYETYTRLCDPHMTSFEPENMGHLIDNMEYRRLSLDQARQVQLNHLYQQQIISSFSSSSSSAGHWQHQASAENWQQVMAATAAAAAAAAASAAQQPATPTKQSSQQLHQITLAAATAALANLNLGGIGGGATGPADGSGGRAAGSGPTSAAAAAAANSAAAMCQQQQQPSLAPPLQSLADQLVAKSASPPLRHYSLLLNPSVYLMGDDAASIAYTKLSQVIDVSTGLVNTEQSEETRVWHRKDGNKWLCVHLHRSLVQQPLQSIHASTHQLFGPQTSVSLIRSMQNQQQYATLHELIRQQQSQPSTTGVPLISLNHSSAGSASSK